MKYISIDTETLGLDPKTCDIIEFGAVIEDTEDPKPLSECPQLRVLFHKELYVGQPFAMGMHPGILKEIADRPLRQPTEIGRELYKQVNECKFPLADLRILWQQFCWENKIQGTPTVAGKNYGMFDHRWLDGLIRVRHRVIDVGTLYWDGTEAMLPNLLDCMQRAGIEGSVAHTSVEDAWDVIQCIRAYYNREFATC